MNSKKSKFFRIIGQMTSIIWILTTFFTASFAAETTSPNNSFRKIVPITTYLLFSGDSSIPDDCTDTGDNDHDRLLNCVETNTKIFVNAKDTGTDPNNWDTDGDAISDGDEVLGTTAGLNLPGMGANPLKKNIFIEYDWFEDSHDSLTKHSHRPTVTAINKVKAAFAISPGSNPDGTTGVDIIQDYGQGGLFTGGNLINDANGYIDGYLSGEFLEHKSKNFSTNRHGYFHYVIMPHQYANGTTESSGLAEVHGDDLIVATVNWYDQDQSVANTIMHELGHNLGLRHGGNENCNYKPNYNSVMNYEYQFPGIDSNCLLGGDHVLSYSVGSRANLNESALNESQGLCNNIAIDWNKNNTIETNIEYNLNPDQDCGGEISTLHDYNDWKFISFNGIEDSDGATPDGKLSVETIICDNYPSKNSK